MGDLGRVVGRGGENRRRNIGTSSSSKRRLISSKINNPTDEMSVDRPLPSFVGNSAWLEEKMEDPEGWNRVRDIGSERDRERRGGGGRKTKKEVCSNFIIKLIFSKFYEVLR